MKLDLTLSIETPVKPGDRVRWLDIEYPRPPEERLVGRVRHLNFEWDGTTATLDSVGVVWEKDGDRQIPGLQADDLPADELDRLEVIA